MPPCVGDELEYVKQAIDAHKICGDGAFTKMCNNWMEERFHTQKVLLTTSGTTALDLSLIHISLLMVRWRGIMGIPNRERSARRWFAN